MDKKCNPKSGSFVRSRQNLNKNRQKTSKPNMITKKKEIKINITKKKETAKQKVMKEMQQFDNGIKMIYLIMNSNKIFQ
jgi:hypothetical protein